MDYIRGNDKNVKKNIILGGDLNINTLTENTYTKRLIDIMSAYGLKQCYNVPTRIVKGSKTCIDHIFTSFSVQNVHILEPGLSDHTAQLVQVAITQKPSNSKTFSRRYPEENIKLFIKKLENENWQPLYNLKYENNSSIFVNSIYEQFLKIVLINFNAEFPKKTNTVSNPKHAKKRWLTNEIVNLSSKKRQLFISLKLNPADTGLDHRYRECKLLLKKKISKAKIEHNNKIIDKADNVSKASWNIVNAELGKSNLKNSNTEVDIGEQDLKQNSEAANLLNKHFSTVTERLNLKPNKAEALRFSKNYVNNIEKSMFLGPVDTHEILSVIKKIKNKKSSGWDEIPMFLIKRVGETLAPHLAYIFNHCLTFGIFPDLLKYSVIKPIPKNNTKTLDNFRPISLLSVFSNMLERIILNRLLPFLTKYNILNKEQFGFREQLSTIDAIVKLTNHIFENFDNKTTSAAIFCDLSKAFDSMDRNTLLQKMENYGIRGITNDIFKSYFDNRYQKVLINNQGKIFESEWEINHTGCPQGSILGPVLFLIFVADLPLNTNSAFSDTIQYADDTSVIVKEGGERDLEFNLNESIKNLNLWFNMNGLKLNENKTEIIKFNRRVSNRNTNIRMNNDTAHTKFLGLIIDARLDFSFHTKALSKKLNSACFSLRVLSNSVDKNILRKVYFGNVQSILTYGLIIWGGASVQDFNRIFRIQKRALRIIHNAPADEPCNRLFREFKVMTLTSLYVFELSKYFLKNINLFNNTNSVYNTRHKFIQYPSHTTAVYEKSTYYMTCKIINKFLTLDKETVFNKSWLKKIKSYLTDNAFYTLNEFLDSNINLN